MRRVIVLGAVLSLLLANPAQGLEREPCRKRLSQRGVEFTRGPAAQGVANPVTVALPLGGIEYHRPGVRRPQRHLFVDCSLALALHEMGQLLRARGIDAVEHLGTYEYRCIEGSSPCELSRHASATAIDLHEFRGRRGRNYNVERHWVIDPAETATCSPARRAPRDRFLHSLACGWSAKRLFNVILTPNFNADHRNHFHVDLTPAEHYIR